MGFVIDYLVEMILPALLGVLAWALTRPLRRAGRARHGAHPGSSREGALLILFIFTAGLLGLTLTPFGFWSTILLAHQIPALPEAFQGGVNLIPLRETIALYAYWMRHGLQTHVLINFLGNILMFAPIGFFAGLLMDRPRWWKAALVTAGLSLFIEVFQLIVSRGTDVDDLILNTLGGLVGYWVFLLVRNIDPGLVGRCAKR